jgi:hypothetical protein
VLRFLSPPEQAGCVRTSNGSPVVPVSHDTPAIGVGRPTNSSQKLQAEGRDSRQKVLDYLLECLTSPANPTTVEQLTEFKMTSWYFPDIKQATDKVERVFADREDLRKAIMLAAAYEILERLIA